MERKISDFSLSSLARRRRRLSTPHSNPSRTSSFLLRQVWAAILFLPLRRMSLISVSWASLRWYLAIKWLNSSTGKFTMCSLENGIFIKHARFTSRLERWSSTVFSGDSSERSFEVSSGFEVGCRYDRVRCARAKEGDGTVWLPKSLIDTFWFVLACTHPQLHPLPWYGCSPQRLLRASN